MKSLPLSQVSEVIILENYYFDWWQGGKNQLMISPFERLHHQLIEYDYLVR